MRDIINRRRNHWCIGGHWGPLNRHVCYPDKGDLHSPWRHHRRNHQCIWGTVVPLISMSVTLIKGTSVLPERLHRRKKTPIYWGTWRSLNHQVYHPNIGNERSPLEARYKRKPPMYWGMEVTLISMSVTLIKGTSVLPERRHRRRNHQCIRGHGGPPDCNVCHPDKGDMCCAWKTS